MDVIVDSCSIILLGKITILESFTKTKNVLITKGVYEEVIANEAEPLFGL